MRRFQRKPELGNMFHLFNICAASAALLLCWCSSWFLITHQPFSHVYGVSLMPLFNHSFYAFLLLNAIVLFVHALSNRITTSEAVNDPAESCWRVVCNSEVGDSSSSSLVFEETVTTVTETTATCCTTVAANEDKVSEKKCNRRVRSESYDAGRVAAAPRRELKRFSTGLNGEPQRRLCCVERLNKDEFNRAVEDFIAKHKKMMQWEEQMIGSQKKTEYLVFTQ